MIKCSNNALLSIITKLFNLILDSGYYPEAWNHGLIDSIHKNGSKEPFKLLRNYPIKLIRETI